MARPRNFDPDDLTDRALVAFWRLGYDGCAISDLVVACGVNRQTLYNQFGDKRGAFLASLARYRAYVAEGLRLLAPREPAQTLAEVLLGFIEATLAVQAARGAGACLLVITASTPHMADPAIRAAVTEGAAQTRAALAGLVADRVPLHQRSGATAEVIGAYLYSLMNGLAADRRTGGDPATTAAMLHYAIKTLCPGDR